MGKKSAGTGRNENKSSGARQTKSMKAFRGLSPVEKSMVEMLAIVYQFTTMTDFVNCLRKLKIRMPDGKAFSGKTAEPYVRNLEKVGVVERQSYHFRCARKVADEIALELAKEERFAPLADAVRQVYPMLSDWSGNAVACDYEHLASEIRMGIFERDAIYVEELLASNEEKFRYDFIWFHPYADIFRNKQGLQWLVSEMPEEFAADVLAKLLDHASKDLSPFVADVYELLQGTLERMGDAKPSDFVATTTAWWKMLSGRFDEAERDMGEREDMEALLLKGFAAFAAGRNDEALGLFDDAHAMLKKSSRKRKIYFRHPAGIFFIVALIKRGEQDDLFRASGYCTVAGDDDENVFRAIYMLLDEAIRSIGEDPDAIATVGKRSPPSEDDMALVALVQALCAHWVSSRSGPKLKTPMERLHAKAQKCGAEWIEVEAAELCSRFDKSDTVLKKRAEDFRKKTGTVCMADAVRRPDKWERVLNAMIDLTASSTASGGKGFESNSRMVWLFSFSDKNADWDLSPREQKRNAKGVWSKGRKIALKRLKHELKTFDFLTPQDVEICRHIEEDSYYWRGYPETSYYFDDKTPLALVGHPLIFWEKSPATQVEIVKGDAELVVGKTKSGYMEISFPLDLQTEKGLQLVREGPDKFKAIEVGDDLLKIAKLVGNGVKVPEKAKDSVLKAVASVSSIVTVHSEIEEAGRGAEEVPSDPSTRVHIRPMESGLKVEFFCRPFSSSGPYVRPGRGKETVIARIEGRALRARRDLEKERELAEEVLAACPSLFSLQDPSEEDWGFRLPDPEDCLEVLLELRELGDRATVAWPEGESYRIRAQADAKNFFVGIKKSRDWFSVSGQLKIDDGLVLDLKKLLELIQDAPGRFVRLDDGRFLALTRAFKKRLEEIEAWSKPSGDGRRFHPLAAFALDDMSGEFGGLKGDKSWKEHMKRLDDARKLDPVLPSTFKASLRDYQREGFLWLMRLSRWGVGACLADDMGLGKTVQALAAILANAPDGPSLVVAPTSVRMNWRDEAARFAPTLNVTELGGGDRQEAISKLGAFDLLLVTYGLLQQAKTAEMLSDVQFSTIVLDEAQAIKNFSTRRSKAAMELQGNFKLITTGTPLENHLGELWNLFRFINQGLLGSLKEFNEKYAVPVERHRDRSARQRLQKLVRPFILRRSKSQVLEELPSRTDIVLRVDPTREQMAFYEALRQKALETLDQSDAPGHLQILAEITRLRRACCHPRLVHPDVSIGSAKLDAFAELSEELLKNGHKALVFSQFVGHLAFIREHLDARGVSYQYLDGSMPAKEREKRVNAFQAGEGEMFLISLKAGGTGLNLTAADYVIHMDPWWNPAVEDQASDRAHRIGQTRPVTVYRLVAKDTIEEKILGLHRQKRDLADSLLEGADMTGKISADELLRLIREPA